jgi:hypothetical protein
VYSAELKYVLYISVLKSASGHNSALFTILSCGTLNIELPRNGFPFTSLVKNDSII